MHFLHINGKNDSQHDLEQHLLPGKEAVRTFFSDFYIVIRKSDQPESQRQDQDRNGLSAPPERKDASCDNSQKDHDPPHVGSSCLLDVALGAVISFRLPRLQSSEEGNQEFSGYCADCEGSQKRDYSLC